MTPRREGATRQWPGVPPPNLPGRPPSRVARPVEILYRRPPDRLTRYRQWLVHDDGRVKVTLARRVPLPRPLRVAGRVVLEPGADAVWFTFPGAWHDIGIFHEPNGQVTGIYANVITPCLFRPGGIWTTTDLFLDVWVAGESAVTPRTVGTAVRPHVLDRDELAEAARTGAVTPEAVERAEAEVDGILRQWRQRNWPPPIVAQWSRHRALAVLEM